MPRSATIRKLPHAFRMMGAMQAQGIEWDTGYRDAAAAALKDVREGSMGAGIDCHLQEMAAGEADRRQRQLPSLADDGAGRHRAHRAAHASRQRPSSGVGLCPPGGHIDRMILACFALGLSTRKVNTAHLPVLGRRIRAGAVSQVAKTLDAAVVAALLRPEQIHRRPGLDQRAVHRELVRAHLGVLCLIEFIFCG